MSNLWNLWKSEPAMLIGALRAVLVAAVGFGLNLSTDQITLLILAFESILTILTRTAVFSPANVAKLTAAGAVTVLEAAAGSVVTDVPALATESLDVVTDLLGPVVDPETGK